VAIKSYSGESKHMVLGKIKERHSQSMQDRIERNAYLGSDL